MKKRSLQRFSSNEQLVLKEHFEQNNYPNRQEKLVIAKQLGVSFEKITRWYDDYRRSKKKKFLQMSSRCK